MSNVHMTETVRHDIRVKVETAYIEEQSDPEQNRYVFAYSITITNIGTVTAQLLRRHWSMVKAWSASSRYCGRENTTTTPAARCWRPALGICRASTT